MLKKNRRIFFTIAIVLSLISVACGSKEVKQKDSVRPQDNFYQSVNAEWLATTKLPEGVDSIGGSSDLSEGISDTLKRDFKNIKNGEVPEDMPELEGFIKYYNLALNYDKRDSDGINPLLATLEKVESISSLQDLNNMLPVLIGEGYTTPITIEVMADMKDVDNKALYSMEPTILLDDKSYYEKDNEEGREQLSAYEKMFSKMLVMVGKDKKEADRISKEAIEFDKLLAEYSKTAKEKLEFENLYNPVTIDEYNSLSSHIDLKNLVNSLTNTMPEKVILGNLGYNNNLDKIISEENFEKIKSWIYVHAMYDASGYLSEEFEEAGSEVDFINSGSSELDSREDRAYDLADTRFSDLVGIYYGNKYFGDEAKDYVTNMTKEFIEVYIERLSNNDWLTEATRLRAIDKLNNMSVLIGYPDEIPEIYSRVSIDDNISFYENHKNIDKLFIKQQFSDYSEPVNRLEWELNAHEVNAMYSPLSNKITFPAAILQEPYFSMEYDDSQNYGAIGTVIAHEISHGFDPIGSKFDEKGNMINWWTDEDHKAYEEKADIMRKQFDGIEYAGGKIDGTLTLSENVADAGGLKVALEALKKTSDVNLEEFFISWANIWREKSTPERKKLLLIIDNHSPNEIRTNMQLSNIDDFYETFNVKEGDGMYIPPEERITIW